jgi:copper transporter 1
MSLEFLRRMGKEYDLYLIRQHQLAQPAYVGDQAKGLIPSRRSDEVPLTNTIRPPFRPKMKQQAARATFYMLQFAVVYFVLLLAMYYNGFILLSICIGAWFGSFVFDWESVSLRYVKSVNRVREADLYTVYRRRRWLELRMNPTKYNSYMVELRAKHQDYLGKRELL